ncbi:MAG TPA: hypothetical protein VJO15_07470, partial [Dehalococcoidia bacterium]|nr:hypothetical protein [Dehalococcoidia bacterium]
DVDYVAQELRGAGLDIRIDRQQIRAGLRLWEQIDRFISQPAECDAWMIYARRDACSTSAKAKLSSSVVPRGGMGN